jgi:predicted ATPase
MYLSSLSIKNYRSLEDVELENLSQFNVLIGRNNAGKSSVFNVLLMISRVFRGEGVIWERVISRRDMNRELKLVLMFQLRPNDRAEFIDLLIAAGHQGHRREDMLHSPLLRQIEYTFKAPTNPVQNLHLHETRIRTEDNNWATVQRVNGDIRTSNPNHQIILLGPQGQQGPLILANLKIESGTNANLQPQQFGSEWTGNAATTWIYRRLVRYFADAFFFNPFRHSAEQGQAQETPFLSQDGSNLAQVLLTINSNNRPKFLEIEQFIQTALPDVGILQTPLRAQQTEINFRSLNGNHLIPLHDMGGGIEQLLMAATVLLTTGDENTIFLEEPESHLHAGAQRFLIERLYEGSRQVFITTHSPTFVNHSRPRSLYQIRYRNGQTSVIHVADADSLSPLLEDIGARNSDVLLSDAVCFVEGPGDRDTLRTWSETLGSSLTERNITLLPMGGGEFAERGAPIRSEVLTGISQKSPVPHIFVLDRDERSQAEIDRLQQRLPDLVRFWSQRELENYLLIPRAILGSLREKYHDNAVIIEKLENTSKEQIQQLMRTTAQGLYGQVLLKRIRSEVGGLPGGLLRREEVSELIPYARTTKLSPRLKTILRSRVEKHITGLDIQKIVEEQRKALDMLWFDENELLRIVPGEEVLSVVFQTFGGEYKKPKDTVRIAQAMTTDEIDGEIKAIIAKVIKLTERKQTSQRV